MPHRDAVVGYFLFTTIVSVIALEFISAQYSGIANLLTWVAIASGWAAAALLLHRTRVAQRASVALMILVGVAALLVVRSKGVDAPWQAAVFQSLPLVTMIMSVGFLKRIVLSAMAAEAPLPVGSTAFRDTALAIALFGSFINISVAIMVGDRLSRHEPLGHYNAAAITRAFSTCVNWSPFFAGLAVVISYSPSFSLPIVMLQGVPLALMGLFVITVLARRNPAALAKFRGFPIKWTSLWIPTVLAITVLSLRYLLPALALLPVIALSALLVVIITLCVSHGVARAARTMHQHIVTDLPLSFNELTLLLGVGVLAAGLVAWVNLGLLQWQPLSTSCDDPHRYGWVSSGHNHRLGHLFTCAGTAKS